MRKKDLANYTTKTSAQKIEKKKKKKVKMKEKIVV